MIYEHRIQRWLDFYRPGSSLRFLLLIDMQEDASDRPWPTPQRWAEREAWAWCKYHSQCKRMETLEDDRVPFIDTFTGTEIFAQAFGCQVHYPDDNMPFALPFINTPREADQVRIPPLDATPLWEILEHAQTLYDRSGRTALLRMPDVQTPMDIAALIWEKKSFYTALIETPEAVLALAHRVQQLQYAFFDEWFNRFGTAFIAHYPDYYMPFGITVSEDEVGAVSSRMFTRMFLPELNALSRRYGQIGIHCCANAEHQWDHFAGVSNLVLLNLVQPIDVLQRSFTRFANVCAQYPSNLPKSMAQLSPQDFPAEAHIVFQISAATIDEACRMAEVFQKNFLTD
ncbi:MAG: hypothetical protein HPY85_14830 [Anaerolineae bacterium]|nr:hypothetical protein [Anaerolineae bacterium]